MQRGLLNFTLGLPCIYPVLFMMVLSGVTYVPMLSGKMVAMLMLCVEYCLLLLRSLFLCYVYQPTSQSFNNCFNSLTLQKAKNNL